MNYIEAITNGLDELMENDENVFMMGEDIGVFEGAFKATKGCLLYTSPSPRDMRRSRMPSSA